MEALIAELEFTPSLPWSVLFLRLIGAVVLTAIIGFEREASGKHAGLRTHMLVSLASALYCLITLDLISRDYPGTVRVDPIRMVEAVTAGVAFLAAGLIVFSKGEVRGLTTGASLWLAAATGLCAGLGLWPMAVVATIVAMIIMRLLKVVEKEVIETKSSPHDGAR
ncbi:MgtC/SapB family protein [Pikeienuella piscinae]|uniref:Protein MgtC n=1 Tax=Pikeienuella piscinae TaxID=2748098 RepID=A0A7L5BZC2_9RHOB|nr:MgtC/SapB family protein [Pikeienuella piscinae]QIE54949.1 MgtC/SapB family protein [Pikeienuella piscinae]